MSNLHGLHWVRCTEEAQIGQNSAVHIVILCAYRPVCNSLLVHALCMYHNVMCTYVCISVDSDSIVEFSSP